jgi:hypothetical protein
LVSERYANKNVDHQDMLSSFIAHGLTESDLVAESVMQIPAGGETTATGLVEEVGAIGLSGRTGL